MMGRNNRYFVGDFETTVYQGQNNTEVWASAVVEMYTEDVKIFHSLEDTLNYLIAIESNIIIYYHNLKFDGSFWLSYLKTELEFKEALQEVSEKEKHWLPDIKMKNNTFKYSISDRGQWYTITIKIHDYIIEIRDSLKLLPFSVRQIGDSFGTKHKKLDMEYTGFRYAGCEITEEERHYIANDVLVVKEALEIMYNEGHKELTIGACCLKEYKKIMGKYEYNQFFPDLYQIELTDQYTYKTAGDYIRRAYRGGWCYLVKGKEEKIYNKGVTLDVNSLYPSVMHSESGNYYPVGLPNFWKGNFIPEAATKFKRFYFIRIKTRFYIKKDMLPFLQIKTSMLYKSTETLTTSDIWNEQSQQYVPFYKGIDGKIHDTRMEFTLTMMDYELLKEHYNLVDFEILDGCWFFSEIGLFDEYENEYKKKKQENKGALRTLAKLFLNNLYGKMASSTDSSFKIAYVKDGGAIGFYPQLEHKKRPGYIAVGAAITSYARNFTIKAAQLNYHGVDSPGFIYADTDSIHCDLPVEEIKGITLHDKNFCCWKAESCWDTAIFTRQKTYIEHVTHEDLKPVETSYYNIKCAGMPDKCKQLFELSLLGIDSEEKAVTEEQRKFISKLNDNEKEIIKQKRTLSDFKIGLELPGKLMPKRIPGGVLLVDTTYKMRE